MTTTQESTLTTPDGASLHTKSWLPSTPAKTQILFLHGFSDHADRYKSFFPLLSAHGIAIHALDQRGWGKSFPSPSHRGRTGPTSQVMSDITTFLSSHLPSKIPTYLMGHSMGGQEILYYASTGPAAIRQQLSGYIAVGPWIQLHPKSQPSWLKIQAGRLAGKLMPHFQMKVELDPQVLSHNKEDNESYIADELCHDTGSLQGLDGALTRADELYNGTVTVEDADGVRVLIVHGGEDMVTSCEASRRFFDGLGVRDKRLEVYEGVYHNVHIDAPERLRNDILAFVGKDLGGEENVGTVRSKL